MSYTVKQVTELCPRRIAQESSRVHIQSVLEELQATVATQTELLKQAHAALDTCYRGDYSTGHVIHPSFDEELVDAAHAAIAKALSL